MPKQEMKVHEVFQPGKAEPTDMYIRRPKLEKELEETLSSDNAGLLIGGSGSGKTWLYRKFFDEVKAVYSVLSITRDYDQPIRQLILDELGRLKVGRISQERAGAGVSNQIVAGVEVVREFHAQAALLSLSAKLRRMAGQRRPAYIVVENAEQGLTAPDLFIPDMISLILATQQLAAQRVKLLIVVADDSLRTAMANQPFPEPHMRRIKALPEVSSFTEGEAKTFIHRGFVEKLGLRIRNLDELLLACKDATDLRPDFLSEYCQLVGKAARNRIRVVEDFEIATANQAWSETKLSPYLERIAAFMNTKETRKRVKDKMLYALARRASNGYTRQNIRDLLKDEFPTETFESSEVTSALNSLCVRDGRNEPLLRRFGADNTLFGFAGTTERVATAFALQRRGDTIVRQH
jgi:hypothetical protein